MYPAAMTSPFGRSAGLAQAYRRIGAETSVVDADPHRLIELLFDAYAECLVQARGAMQAGQTEVKGRAISRAARIVDEGLKAGLNLEKGGRLAADLRDLYEYVSLRLVLANVRNDAAILDECHRLVEPLRQAWKDIRPAAVRAVN
ncbi:MAG: flagellar export chaperone FliS [Burkholderiales bacterium]|nr:flagellar export chaperone FliS [Burkholderiales bacterium]